MEASDAQVGSLRTRLLDSVAEKREVLGEASSTELVRSDGGSECRRLAVCVLCVSAFLGVRVSVYPARAPCTRL